MLGRFWTLALLCLAGMVMGCESAPASAPVEPPGDRELGRVEAIYPHLAGSGEWLLEYRLTGATVYVEYSTSRALASDPAWKEALTTRSQVFFDNGEGCMYTASVAGRLPFLDAPPAAAAAP